MSKIIQERQRPTSALTSRRNTLVTEKEQLNGDLQPNVNESIRVVGNKTRQLSTTRNLKKTLDNVRSDQAQNQDPFESQNTRSIWRALGSYIAKQLINGKAVVVPKFGLFTFTATDVNLSGTTNPQLRDKQIRDPVFMVGRDFVSGIERKSNNFLSDQDLKSGICCGDAIRPLELKGVNGIIPKVKINYVEVSSFCSEPKDVCRDRCELVFKSLSDRVRKGEQITFELPFVGRFLVRNRIAGFSFHYDLIQQTKGVTAKQFTVGNIFASLDATHNLNMFIREQKNKTRALGGGRQVVSNDAASWLVENLGIDVNSLPKNSIDKNFLNTPIKTLNKPLKCGSERQLKQNSEPLSISQLDQFERSSSVKSGTLSRPQSSIQQSRNSSALASQTSFLPVADRNQLQISAKSIYQNRINEINIIQLKQLLREFDLPYNGPSTSLSKLFYLSKHFCQQNQVGSLNFKDDELTSQASNFTNVNSLQPVKSKDSDIERQINSLKDIFYQSKRTLFNIFRLGVSQNGQTIDSDGFKRIIQEVDNGNSLTEVDQVFKSFSRMGQATFEAFEKTFRNDYPNSLEMETKRSQLFKAMKSLNIQLSAAQIDGLFQFLVGNENGQLDLNMWLGRIYEDGDNPLQMIREIVCRYNLSQDDLMYQMKIKLWDDPLTQSRIHTAIRNLDQSISDSQIRALFICLKDKNGLVSVPTLIQNLTGKQFETIDFRNKIFSQIYQDIYPNKEAKVIQLFQESDKENCGNVKVQDVLNVLKSTVTSVNNEDLERFVRFLETNRAGKLSYTDFLAQVTKMAKKTHNPFRHLVNRLAYFLEHNQISVSGLIKKISSEGEQMIGLPVQAFANFLKQKVDKKTDLQKLLNVSNQIDIDNDGRISEQDLSTCLKNLNNAAFWRDQSKVKSKQVLQLSQEKSSQIIEQIQDAMGKKEISYKKLFEMFDVDKDNMVSLSEFQRGLNQLIQLSGPVVEQLFRLMDKNENGLVNFDQFLDVMKSQKFQKNSVRDNFDWEVSVVELIRKWITNQSRNVEEAFKCFDKDFDGFVSKQDLSTALVKNLGVSQYEINNTKLERLFQLLDTFKSGQIQLSDFQRLAGSTNIQSKNASLNWKLSAIQQIGLLVSKRYSSLSEGFTVCACQTEKVNFDRFSAFVKSNNLLNGFSLTNQLMQELFSELDPHKKGYLSYNDWKNAFGSFNYCDQLTLELKTLFGCSFSNYESAYQYLLSYSQNNSIIDYNSFKQAIIQLSNERFDSDQIQKIWNITCGDGVESMDKFTFRKNFGGVNYTGNQTVLKFQTNTSSRARSETIKTVTTQSAKWETNVIEKLRSLLKVSSRPMEEIFAEFNPDINGQITQLEFRNAIRKLNIGLSSKEIDQLMQRIDANKDSLIDFQEFTQNLGIVQHDRAMQMRANDRLAKLKELMILHMASPIDAFRYFDENKEGSLNFGAFNRLITKCYEVAHLKAPAYPVVKDIFEIIDIRKDGLIDVKEWQQTFGMITEGEKNLTVKATPLVMWETTREFQHICQLIGKQRKLIVKAFKMYFAKSESTQSLFTLKQGKEALDSWLYQNFKGSITDEQLKCVLRVAQVPLDSKNEPQYDYMRLVEVYKARHCGPQK